MRLTSQTVWGGILSGLAVLAHGASSGAFGPKAQAVGAGVSYVLGAIGVPMVANGARNAIAKNGNGQ